MTDDTGHGDVGAAGLTAAIGIKGPLLDAAQVSAIAQIAALEASIMDIIKHMQHDGAFDQRCMAIAKTEIQTGFMWLVRAVARPK